MAYDVIVNKKFNYIKLFSIKKSIKGEQNQVSKMLASLIYKYVLHQKQESGDKL